jgi:tRNA(His) 5'-end guanylyltransferase
MRDREIYAELRVIPPIILRVDGRNFKQALDKFEKPFDKRFVSAMADASEMFMRKSGLNPKFAYTFSDEVSIFFMNVSFKGRLEKLDSVVPSFFSSSLTILLDLEEPISFDSKVIPICTYDLNRYLAWRQAEAWRNHVNLYGYYTLIEEGLNKGDATKRMNGVNTAKIHDMLFERGINLNETPAWQRRGVLITKKVYRKPGYNPKQKKNTITSRTKVIQDWDVPIFNSEEGRELVDKLIGI